MDLRLWTPQMLRRDTEDEPRLSVRCSVQEGQSWRTKPNL